MKDIVVQKYGGATLSDAERIKAVARRIVATKERGYNVVVVVSAMGKTTDSLLAQAKSITENPGRRELDMLLSVGERITMSLLSMAIQNLGHEAISFTGSQSGIMTSDSHINARIIDVRPVRIVDELERDRIVIVAGYQGMSYKREITTLGRNGSDTTAVALASALQARWCEICKEVEGVFSADPEKVPEAKLLKKISYREMEVMSEGGAAVLTPEAIEFARSRGLEVRLTSAFGKGEGTLVLAEREPESTIHAVTSQKNIHFLEMNYKSSEELQDFLSALEKLKLPASALHFEGPNQGRLECILDAKDLHEWQADSRCLCDSCPDLSVREDLCTVSVIGTRIGEDAASLKRAALLLSENNIDWKLVLTLRHRFTFLVPKDSEELALKILHDAVC